MTDTVQPNIQIDARKLGDPWHVDEQGKTWLKFDELVIAHNSAMDGKLALHLLHKGKHVFTQAFEGAALVDRDAAIRVDELDAKMLASPTAILGVTS